MIPKTDFPVSCGRGFLFLSCFLHIFSALGGKQMTVLHDIGSVFTPGLKQEF